VSYTWSPNIGITCIDSICGSAVVGPDADTRYTVVAVDSNGCRDTVVVPILVTGPVIFIPNVFTPDANGSNDYFEVYGNKDAFRFMEVKIFGPLGKKKVFESNNINFKWDGTYKGHPLNPGGCLFIRSKWFLQGKTQAEKIYKGSVTLLK